MKPPLAGLPGHIPGAPLKMKVIRSERCEKCKWKGDQIEPGKFECRQGPPTAQSFMVQQGAGRTGFITHTTFPIVQQDGWCGQFHPRIETAN